MAIQNELVELDQSFLTNVVTRPITMKSGRYVLEIRYAGKMSQVTVLDLEFTNGQLAKPSKLPIQHMSQTGSVVFWKQYDPDKGPDAKFVGLIDGDVMWGRVYVEPGQGWREDEPSAYGVWRIHAQPDE